MASTLLPLLFLWTCSPISSSEHLARVDWIKSVHLTRTWVNQILPPRNCNHQSHTAKQSELDTQKETEKLGMEWGFGGGWVGTQGTSTIHLGETEKQQSVLGNY